MVSSRSFSPHYYTPQEKMRCLGFYFIFLILETFKEGVLKIWKSSEADLDPKPLNGSAVIPIHTLLYFGVKTFGVKTCV